MRILHTHRSGVLMALAALIMAGSAQATLIVYNETGSEFVSPMVTFDLSGTGTNGATGDILFTNPGPSTVTPPSNLQYGTFKVTCTACNDLTNPMTAAFVTFPAFTFDLVINDVTDGGTHTFVGTSTGGKVTPTSSTVTVTWLPASEVFGPTTFEIASFTNINSPGSGTPLGTSTIDGHIDEAAGVPEPATLGLIGSGLLGLGMIARKKHSSKT